MNLQTLKAEIRKGTIDTVIVAAPDLFGRLIGKRFTGRHFADSVAAHGTHACNYLLTVNIEMDPLDGFKVANWEMGFGDFEMRPDPTTFRRLPWLPATALVLCDFHHQNGRLVAEAPRSILKRQVERLSKRNWTCEIASELEFFLFNNSFHHAAESDYRNLTPSSDYRIDYHTMQPAAEESLFQPLRNWMDEARVPIESSKGEWGRGQHEVNFVHTQPVAMADLHCLFKQGVKEIAAQRGRSITFMAKPSMSEPGSSCHIHCSLWQRRHNAFWDPRRNQGSKLFRQFLGGLLKYSRELSYCFAPTINSFKRYQSGSWAPTRLVWSADNRTAGFRVVGHGNSFRIENRMPGADANPYLAFAATLSAGIAGIEEALDCGDPYQGNAYLDPAIPSLPSSLEEASDLLHQSALARRDFGDPVVDYLVHGARLEAHAFANSVTNWEHRRYFERI